METGMHANLRFFTAVAALGCASTAAGDVYPSHTITMVAPFAAGAPVDIVGRIFADRMRVSLGQPVIVENVSGAAGQLGVMRVARAPGDGYTVGVGNLSSHVLTGAVYDVKYDLLKDFEPVVTGCVDPHKDGGIAAAELINNERPIKAPRCSS
jgi:tripartite-type tricarboxylate transporter receptor subunit TctC